MDALELVLLYDYYGNLLTDRQRECFEMRYDQDLSLGEIGEELGISRQGVHDNLSRTEALLRNMEEKTGCVRRDRACRKVVADVLRIVSEIESSDDPLVRDAARRIALAVRSIEE